MGLYTTPEYMLILDILHKLNQIMIYSIDYFLNFFGRLKRVQTSTVNNSKQKNTEQLNQTFPAYLQFNTKYHCSISGSVQ